MVEFVQQTDSSRIAKSAAQFATRLVPLLPLSTRKHLLEQLSEQAETLAVHGKRSALLQPLLLTLLKDATLPRAAQQALLQALCEALRQSVNVLNTHGSSASYAVTSGLLREKGFFLESSPCFVCHAIQPRFHEQTMSALCTDASFTAQAAMFRLTSLQRVRALSLRISAPQKRFVRRVSLFFALQPAMEVVDVGSGKWQRFHTVRLPSASAGFTCELSVPFTASHIMIRYDDFHGGPLEAVRCPRCAQVVDARLAICGACGEAVLQCQQCRHINYDVLGAFLCCECGHSRYGQFSLRLTVTPSWQLGSVASDVDFDEGLSMLSNLSSAASCTWADVRRMRGRLHRDILQLPESDSEEDDDDADGSDADTTAALADSSDDSGIDWPPSAASAAGRVSRPSAARIRAAELSPFSSMLPSLTESEAMDDFPLLVGFGDDAAARREQQRARRRDLRRFRRQLSEGRPASRPPSTHSASSASDFPAWRMAWQSDAARPPSSASSSSSPSPWLSLLTSELGGSPSGESSPSGDYSPLLHREWPSGGGGDSMTASVSLRSRAGDRRSSRAALPLRDRDRDRDHDYPPLGRQSSLSSNSSSVSSPVAAFTAAHRSR
eukprot:PLAT2461.2.p1 GENE.PLAT2461.2~~PLAT2461.2.p1  ORF type:complete len:620 (-),score=249.94 PLAT2461.2:13-1839(-)